MASEDGEMKADSRTDEEVVEDFRKRVERLFEDMTSHFEQRRDGAKEFVASEISQEVVKLATEKPYQGVGLLETAKEDFTERYLRSPDREIETSLRADMEEAMGGQSDE